MSVDMARVRERTAQTRANEERNRSICKTLCQCVSLSAAAAFIFCIMRCACAGARSAAAADEGGAAAGWPSLSVFLLHSEQIGLQAFVHCSFVTFWEAEQSPLAQAKQDLASPPKQKPFRSCLNPSSLPPRDSWMHARVPAPPAAGHGQAGRLLRCRRLRSAPHSRVSHRFESQS
jgi:hypothetical protein